MLNKISKVTSVCSLLVSFLLLGCVTPSGATKTPITQKLGSNIDGVEGILIIPQNRLIVSIPNRSVNSADPGVALLGILVTPILDSIHLSYAVDKAEPIRKALLDYDFRAAMLCEASKKLAQTNKIKFSTPLRVVTNGTGPAINNEFDNSTANAILFYYIRYKIESNDLMVTAFVNLYPKSELLKEYRINPNEDIKLNTGNTIYSRSFAYVIQDVTPENIKANLGVAASYIASQVADNLNDEL